MSTHETAADLEAARQIDQADHESRSHEVHRRKVDRGPHLSPHFLAICESCGALGPATDLDDAKRAGRRHATAMSADDVTAGVGGRE